LDKNPSWSNTCSKAEDLAGILDYVMTHFRWHRFVAIQIWIFILFLIYTSIGELNAALGHGQLGKIFLARRSSEAPASTTVRNRRL
jgi:hypothetical protein